MTSSSSSSHSLKKSTHEPDEKDQFVADSAPASAAVKSEDTHTDNSTRSPKTSKSIKKEHHKSSNGRDGDDQSSEKRKIDQVSSENGYTTTTSETFNGTSHVPRKTRSSLSRGNSPANESPTKLEAIFKGSSRPIQVRLMVDGRAYDPNQEYTNHSEGHTTPPPATSLAQSDSATYAESTPEGETPIGVPITTTLTGNDGNQFNCEMCNGFGDVICCDGCPKVYHQRCIPASYPAPQSLGNEEDKWFCPSCVDNGKMVVDGEEDTSRTSNNNHTKAPSTPQTRTRNNSKSAQKEKKQSTGDGDNDDDDLPMCMGCGADAVDSPGFNLKKMLCSVCMDDGAIDSVATPAGEDDTLKRSAQEKRPERERKRKASVSTENTDAQDAEKLRKKKKKKKRVRKESLDTSPTPESATPTNPLLSAAPAIPGIASPKSNSDIVKATPAFIFYLTENRVRIERILSKKHKSFNRMGMERNGLVAAEAASMWSKLDSDEHKKYIDMSMRDFETRIIEWKEDKTIRDMQSDADKDPDGESNLSKEDEKLRWKRHQRLYLNTSVGSKPFKIEPEQAYNRVLQDLLHDSRFHPLPMMCTEVRKEHKSEEYERFVMPYFDVHGPTSTSLGDQCLGCIRGWNHFCWVLQRRIPAVEHRARLQPPVSSLMATRVGLGFRPRLEIPDEPPGEDNPVLEWKKSKEQHELESLPVLQNCTLTNPDDRMDDIALFVEESSAMKMSEPDRPLNHDEAEATPKAQLRPSLPLAHSNKPRSKEDDKPSKYRKCGRCRNIIQGETGCVQCRRAQLVINMAKQKQESKLLKVHTSMLGRYNAKEAGDIQTEDDHAVAAAMLKERWAPYAILPPMKRSVPGKGPMQDYCRVEEQSALQKEDEIDSQSSRARPANGETSDSSSENDSNDGTPEREARRKGNRHVPAAHDGLEPSERQSILESNRRKVSSFQKRALEIACFGMLQAFVRRDPLKFFDEPVTAEGYRDVVENPILFSDIRHKITTTNTKNQYTSIGGFAADVKLLCDNALAFNPPASIYAQKANEILDLLSVMQRRASVWLSAVKDAYASYLHSEEAIQKIAEDKPLGDAFVDLRKEWPEAVQLLELGNWFQQQLDADFVRTEENEGAYFGSLAISRVSVAAEAALAPYPDIGGFFSCVTKRSYKEDTELRKRVDQAAAQMVGPVSLSTPSSWREESVHRLLRKVQSRRLDRITASAEGCSRCDGVDVNKDVKLNMKADAALGKNQKAEEIDLPRLDGSRIDLTTGRGSINTRQSIIARRHESETEQYDTTENARVSVRGSEIHGLGLFADQEFKRGEVVAEYVGEWIKHDDYEKREAIYRQRRLQDYSFRLDSDWVIDATLRGGPARYANHNCNPNCASKILPGSEPHVDRKRVMIVATRTIRINEEITYDYQFPLEDDLTARIPCTCGSDDCRGFLNWDLPEKGSNNRPMLVQKRGANMRDRIRRLNRPLKRDEGI